MASVRERVLSDGGSSWAVLYRHGNRQSSKAFETEKAALAFKMMVDSFGPDRALKMLASEDEPVGVTVDELAARFLEFKAGDVTERTMKDYGRDIANWISPWFGHRTAESIDEGDVQGWVDHMKGKGNLAPKSVADRHMLLHSMFDYGRAKSRRLVTHNPCKETSLPKRTKKPPKGTTVPEFRVLLQAAREVKGNHDAADLILFLGETGWRWSEAAALDFRDVEDNGVDVWVTVSQVFRLDGSYRQVVAEDSAKSYKAFRRIRMFPETAAMLRRRLIGKGPGDLVFLNSRGNHWNQNTFLRTTWPGILKASGIATEKRQPTPHWLRHMHVAVCAAAGIPMHEIQRRVGHEHYSTTVDVYGGLIGDISDDSLAKAADLMAGRASAPSIAPSVVRGSVVIPLDGP